MIRKKQSGNQTLGCNLQSYYKYDHCLWHSCSWWNQCTECLFDICMYIQVVSTENQHVYRDESSKSNQTRYFCTIPTMPCKNKNKNKQKFLTLSFMCFMEPTCMQRVRVKHQQFDHCKYCSLHTLHWWLYLSQLLCLLFICKLVYCGCK